MVYFGYVKDVFKWTQVARCPFFSPLIKYLIFVLFPLTGDPTEKLPLSKKPHSLFFLLSASYSIAATTISRKTLSLTTTTLPHFPPFSSSTWQLQLGPVCTMSNKSHDSLIMFY